MSLRKKRLNMLPSKPRRPKLRFTPTAWAKLLYLRDLGPTEVGGFGVTRPDDLLLVDEIQLVHQRCTETFVAFDDVAVAEHFETQADLGRRPEQCGRIWIHTHPGNSPHPSRVDVQTFQRVFGQCDWAVMFIIARGGQAYAELLWRHGGPASIRLGVEVDYSQPFARSDHDLWEREYLTQVETHSQFDPQRMDYEDDWLRVSPLGTDTDRESAGYRRSHELPIHREPAEPAPF